jgi:hypothetical protein
MRSVNLASLLLSALLSSGCLVGSLHPFYDADSLEFDEALLGEWENREEALTIRVDRGEWKSYKVKYPASGGPVVLTGFLTRIGDSRVLDLTTWRPADPASLLVPIHLAVRVQLLGDSLTVAPMDYDRLLSEVERGRLPRLHPVLDGRKNVLLTAETAALRAWLGAARAADVFGEPTRFTRRQ